MSRALVLGCDPGLRSFGWVVVELFAEPKAPPGDLFGRESREHVIAFGTIETAPEEKVKGKKKGKKSDDQLRRIVELAETLGAVVQEHGEIGAISAEAQSWPHVPDLETTAFMQRDVSADRIRRVKSEILARFDAGNLDRGELVRRLGEIVPSSSRSLDAVEGQLARHARATYGVLNASTMIAFSWGVLGCLAALLGLEVVQVSPQMMRSRLIHRRGGSKALVHDAIVDRYGEAALSHVLAMPKGKREHVLDALGAVVTTLDEKPIARLRAELYVEGDIDFG